MDNLLEIIGTIAFIAIYFFGNMLSGKSDDAEGSSKSPRGRPSSEETEAAERQRKIQEEIRRKIMERRQTASGTPPPTPAAQGRTSVYDEEQRKRRLATEARRGQREVVKEVTPPPVRREVEPPPIVKQAEGFSWEESDNAYESQMEQQLKQIEATKRQAERLKKQAGVESMNTRAKRSSGKKRGFSGPVRSQLKDPAAARAAFIYGEVLGQPISQRKNSSVPGLN